MTRRLAVAFGLTVAVLVSVLSLPTDGSVSAQTSNSSDSGFEAIHLVVDTSGSMGDPDGAGRIKINGAKQAITALLDGLVDSDLEVGLRSYPADTGDCGAGRPNVPFTNDRAEVGRVVRGLQADGGTPTAEALRAAAGDITARGDDDEVVIVLISDGESTCGDPCEVAQELRDEGVMITVNTIGFDISDDGAEELACIAEATGGVYRQADDVDELTERIIEVSGSTLDIDVDAPATVLTSVGRGQSETVTISVTVSNTSQNFAPGVEARLSVVSERAPFIGRPVRSLGSLSAGAESPQVDWTFTPPLDFEDIDIDFELTARAQNALPVVEAFTVSLRGSVSLDDVGPNLQGHDHVVILGDSYSSGEGAGGYRPDTDDSDNACHRSDNTYGADIFPDRTILACSGAVTANIIGNEGQYGEMTQIDQLREVDRPIDLLLTTIGGNDAGFSNVIKRCVLIADECQSSPVVLESTCRFDGGDPDTDISDEVRAAAEAVRAEWEEVPSSLAGIGLDPFGVRNDRCYRLTGRYGDSKVADAAAMVPDLVTTYDRIDRVLNSPDRVDERGDIAPILVLAYPNPVPSPSRFREVLEVCVDSFDLGPIGLVSYEEWRWIAGEFVPAVNGAVRDAVDRAAELGIPIRFVEQSQEAFAPSHTICDGDPFINGLLVGDSVAAGLADGRAFGLLFSYAFDLPVGFVITALDARDEAERSAQQSFHPNADGYRAMTAALVEWSTSPEGEVPIVRDRSDSNVDTSPTFLRRFIEFGFDDPFRRDTEESPYVLDFVHGTTSELVVDGLTPGTLLQGSIESRRTVSAPAIAGENGVARLVIAGSADLALGPHTLTLTGVDVDGHARSVEVPVMVDDAVMTWEEWSPVVARIAGLVAVTAALLWALVFGWSGRRKRAMAVT